MQATVMAAFVRVKARFSASRHAESHAIIAINLSKHYSTKSRRVRDLGGQPMAGSAMRGLGVSQMASLAETYDRIHLMNATNGKQSQIHLVGQRELAAARRAIRCLHSMRSAGSRHVRHILHSSNPRSTMSRPVLARRGMRWILAKSGVR